MDRRRAPASKTREGEELKELREIGAVKLDADFTNNDLKLKRRTFKLMWLEEDAKIRGTIGGILELDAKQVGAIEWKLLGETNETIDHLLAGSMKKTEMFFRDL